MQQEPRNARACTMGAAVALLTMLLLPLGARVSAAVAIESHPGRPPAASILARSKARPPRARLGLAPRSLGEGGSGRAIAYVNDLVREHLEQQGEARVIVVLGNPSLPQAWARDWRERGAAIGELTRRVRADAPHFRVGREYQVFPFIAGVADAAALKELASSPVVEAVYPDREHHAVLNQSGPLIGQPEAELAGYDGAGIGIAIIDSGVDYTHPDLGGGGFPNAKVVGGTDVANNDADPKDDNGHGTWVAGIAAGTGSVYRGIAPGAKIIAIKVLDSEGYGYTSDITYGLDWCITHKAEFNIKVANLSLSDGAEWRDPADCDADTEGQAISDTVAAGILVTVAAGNEGYTHGVGMPACASDAVAVGATWDSGAEVDTPASFSNRGELLDVYAPGIWITSADLGTGYVTEAGTSAAAPHVAGAAAVLFDMLGPAATPSTVAARLARTGVQIVDTDTDVASPRIDLVRAMGNLPSSGPDLVVTAVSSTTSSGLQGAAVSVSVTVKNQGDEASTACSVVIGLSDNQVASPQDGAVATVAVPALSVGQTWPSGAVSGTVPTVRPGNYQLSAFADSGYGVSEKEEGNNGRVGASFTVNALLAYVQSTTIPSSVLKGASVPVTVTFRNDGSTPWTSADGFALSSASPLGSNTWGVSHVSLPTSSVAPGGSVTFSFTITAPAAAGLYPCHWQMVRGSEPFGEIAIGATRTRVLDDAQWGQAYSAVSGDWVAYEDYSILPGLDAAISVSNMASGGRSVLPDNIAFQRVWDSTLGIYVPPEPYKYFEVSIHWLPDISGSQVAWMVNDYPLNQWYFQIVAEDVQNLSALPARLTYQNKDAIYPAIDGNIVVWEDYRNDPDGTWGVNFLDDNSDIYIGDITDVTGPDDHFPQVHPLCTAPGPQFAPRISGDLVVWEDWRDTVNAQSDIYAYDLSVDSDGDGIPNWKETAKPSPDPAEIRLTNTTWPEEFPDISDGTVVYMDLARDTGAGETIDLYALTIDGPTRVAVATDPPAVRFRPRISYPLVVWTDYTNDSDGPTGDGLSDNPDVYFYNLDAGVGGPLAAGGGIESWPDVSGNRVSYVKHRATVTPAIPGVPTPWPVYNIWMQQLPPEGMTGVCTFSDVPATFWAWKNIEASVAHDVVQGYTDGTYQPTWTVTRDQMAVYIARAMAGGDGNVPDGPATPSFNDVDSTHWAYKYIEYCAAPAQDVVKGFEDGTYQPDQPVNRGQMAAYIGRALAGGDSFFDSYVPPGGPSFPDVATDFWAYKYVEYIADAGVTQGYPDGKYHPEVDVARDQMAVYISKAFGYMD